MLGNAQVGAWSGPLSPLLPSLFWSQSCSVFFRCLSPSSLTLYLRHPFSCCSCLWYLILITCSIEGLSACVLQCLCDCSCCHESHVALLSASACLLYVQRLWSSVAPPGLKLLLLPPHLWQASSQTLSWLPERPSGLFKSFVASHF